MTYRVILAPDAEADLSAACRYIRRQAPRAAREWIRSARQSVRSLAQHPERCPLAPESALFDEPNALFLGTGKQGVYRILFVIIEQSVYALHLRQGSRLPLAPGE